MKLNEVQIQDLYRFTRSHFVVYYDLQTELVDHLANDIEAMWEEQPQLSFEDAKTKAFKKFGIFGFMEPIEQKQKAMNKRYMRYLWTELKKWFALPQIVITITMFLAFYLAFTTSYAKYFVFGFYILIAIWSGYKGVCLKRQFKKRKEASDKKWMLEEMIFRQASGSSFFLLLQLHNVFNISDGFSDNNYIVLAFASIFTFLILISYISLELLPGKAEELINETYPEFSL
ncbi:hypothetical protein [Lacinutrix algicola]|uniref:hypothetical protein n=1 Tax=Lacinutrix algicola TaxID=342954 RepID=UPI0006E33C1D|nr:hypothetical protein [Lacinutrix algicola]